jgi:hypothetical protein
MAHDNRSWASLNSPNRISNNEVPDCAKQVYNGGSLCALLCAEASEGDILPSSTDRPENLLVLRRLDGEDYRVVGQALTVNGFHLWHDEQYFNTRVNLKLTILEALLLYGQDFLGFDSLEEAMYDRQAQVQRLRTPVVLDPVPAARARVVQSGRTFDHIPKLFPHRLFNIHEGGGGFQWSETDSESPSMLGNPNSEEEDDDDDERDDSGNLS